MLKSFLATILTLMCFGALRAESQSQTSQDIKNEARHLAIALAHERQLDLADPSKIVGEVQKSFPTHDKVDAYVFFRSTYESTKDHTINQRPLTADEDYNFRVDYSDRALVFEYYRVLGLRLDLDYKKKVQEASQDN